ncbi:MAG: NAD(P)H-binding protein [Alcanivoracaceae bacterium]
MSRSALLLGATGLVGGLVLERLLQRPEWSSITLLGRRHPSIAADTDKIHRIDANLDQLSGHSQAFQVDDVFCCLGTTLRQAGSREAFARVDLDYCVAAAELARASGVQRFLMVSAVNANPRGVSFYARTKGEAERRIGELGFPVTIFMQPSLLQGHRQEFRFGEEAGLKTLGLVMPLVRWSQADWLPVQASAVADAMVSAALHGPQQGIARLRYRQIHQYAEQLE